MILKKVDKDLTGKFQTNNSLVRNSLSSPKTRHDVQLSKSKGVRVRLGPSGAKSAIKVKETATSPDFAQEHQVAKRQKLECGNSGEESSTSPIQRKAKLSFTRPKRPQFEFSRRGHSVRVKSFVEIEEDMMANIPKFKARPVNKKILQSKGDLGLFSKPKRQVTRPQEFHFATDERIPPEKSVIDLFDKLSLNSEPRHLHQIKRITTPNPFHLNTEERGAEKKQKFLVDVRKSWLEEERARIPRATSYPYTTDYPVIPPKPEPKQCTKPEPFQLESLVRHEEELQKKINERKKLDEEAAQMRLFQAQTILKDDPLPVSEKKRKPLTQVKEFALYADNRAIERSEFDEKVKEKDMMHKRYKEELESAIMMEEEKALKQLRKTLVSQARPIPNFDKPFRPRKSPKEPTKAKSPKLRVVQRKQKWTRTAASELR